METNIRPLSPIYTLEDFPPPGGEYNEATLRFFFNKMEPTEEDMKRQLTNNELKEICTKYKCRVDAYRWNPVHDYKKFLMRKGTLDLRSTRHELRHLAKAVNRHKHSLKYDEELIRKTREREWRIQKKDNILSLDLWAYEREQKNKEKEQSQTVEIDANELTVGSECEVATETGEHQSECLENNDFQLILSEELEISHDEAQNHILFPSHESEIGSDDGTDEIENGLDSIDTEFITTQYNAVRPNSTDTELIGTELNSEVIEAFGANKDRCRIFDINTESMTLCDSDELPSSSVDLSEGQERDLPSQQEYEEFGTQIPLTSTQSQK